MALDPEIMAVAVDVLKVVGKKFDIQFEFTEALIGGAAIDATGEPLPAASLDICRNSDAVLLGGYWWLQVGFPAISFTPGSRFVRAPCGVGFICQFAPCKNLAPID
jgi:3-isopropylmalate dehydrogenase